MTAQRPLPPDQALERRAGALVRTITGSAPAKVDRIPKGVMTVKLKVETQSGESYVVRFYPPSRSYVVEYEAPVMALLGRDKRLPVPELVASSSRGPSAELAYLVYRFVPGRSLRERLAVLDRGALDRLTDQLVSAIREMASYPVSGFGDLEDAGHARYPDWLGFVESSFQAGARAVRELALLPAHRQAQLQRISIAAKAFEPTGEGRLVWADASPDNILLDERDRLAAIIDFESLLAVEPVASLGYVFAGHRDTAYFQSLWDAWPAADASRLQERTAFYALLRALRIAPYAGEPLPTGGARTPLPILLPGLLDALDRLSGDIQRKPTARTAPVSRKG